MELTFTKTAYDDLASFLDECQLSLTTLEKLKSSRSVLGSLIGACKDEFLYLKEALEGIVASCSLNKEYIVRGLYLKAYASFENFFRQLVSVIVSEINNCGQSGIKDEINQKYIRNTGKILSMLNTSYDFGQFNLDHVLQSAISLPTGERIWDGEVMSHDIKSINMERIEDILKRVSVQINWFRIIEYDIEPLKKILGTIGNQNIKNEIESFLKKSLKNRNRIAHLGQSASDVQEQDLLELIEVLKTISKGICLTVEEQVNAKCYLNVTT